MAKMSSPSGGMEGVHNIVRSLRSSLILPILIILFGFIQTTGGSGDGTFCDVALMGQLGTGVITSYNYPFQYRHNLTCTYRIYVNNPEDQTKKICFTFHRFALESSTAFCSYDYLQFENTKYCGNGWWQFGSMNDNPANNIWKGGFCWTVKGEYFDIHFNSDNNLSGNGFYAEYSIQETPDGSMPQEAPVGTAPCSDDEWTCFNRKCIGRAQLCDGEDNCGDRSDETYTHARCGEQSVLACDFAPQPGADGYCGFQHDGWFRTNEQHSPYGPKGDHTNTTHGYYVYSDVNESVANLISAELTLAMNKTYCLAFWYFVYGSPAAAALRVYISREQAYSRPEWTRTAAPEGEWLKGEITFRAMHPLQAIFAAELDNSFSGVALDDISVLPGACTGNDISCNFESGTCAWSTPRIIRHWDGELQGDLTWRVHNRMVAPVGPFWDHSSRNGGGFYLFLNYTTDKTKNNRAILVSPPISAFAHEHRCLRFWYFMNGMDRDCALLRVKVHGSDDHLSEAIWSQSGDVRSAWKEAFINLSGRNRTFQLVIEGIVSEGSQGKLALDEMLLVDGPCTDIDTGGSACEVGQYLCHTGKCINSTFKCDGAPHCEDRSDEDWRAGCTAPTTSEAPGVATCPSTHYRCYDDGKCIPRSWVCDSFKDCTDNSDESPELAGCPASHTPSETPAGCRGDDQYLCHNSVCIPRSRHCDGSQDCTDGSDEINCNGTASPSSPGGGSGGPSGCPPGQFQCLDTGQCILKKAKCDGTKDCSDGSDENEEDCNKVPHPGLGTKLGAGELAGLCIGVLVLLAIIIVLIVLCCRRRQRNRQKPPVRRTMDGPRRVDTSISTISRYTDDTTLDRQLGGMLEAMRNNAANNSAANNNNSGAPQGSNGPPPYCEQQNRAYTPERGLSGGSVPNGVNSNPSGGAQGQGSGGQGHMLPPDEPPPPYDAIIKPGEQNQTRTPGHNSMRDSQRMNGQRLNTVLPSLGEPTLQSTSQQQQQQLPALPPLPDDRPPISPSGSGRTLPRIRLGTTPLHNPHPRGKNYMNQQNPGGPNYPPLGMPLNYMNYDTDGDNSSVDHIYETLNLPDSRPQTPRATPPTTSATPPTLPPGGRGVTSQLSQQQAPLSAGRGGNNPQTYRPQNYHPSSFSQHLQMTNLSSPGANRGGGGGGQDVNRGGMPPSTAYRGLQPRPQGFNSPQAMANARLGIRPGPLSPGQQLNHNIPFQHHNNMPGQFNSQFSPGQQQQSHNVPTTRHNGPMSPGQPISAPGGQTQTTRSPLVTSLSQQHIQGSNPNITNHNPGGQMRGSNSINSGLNTPPTSNSYPQLSRNNAMVRGSQGQSPAGYRPGTNNNSTVIGSNSYRDRDRDDHEGAAIPHSRTGSNLTHRSRTPDSQCHLLPASNNSSFDNTTPPTHPHHHNNNNHQQQQQQQQQQHPRQDSGASVVFSNLEDNLLPTTV